MPVIHWVQEIASCAEGLGLEQVQPIVLRDAGNLVVHLAPHPIVARVYRLVAGYDRDALQRRGLVEVRVAQHLREHGVPVGVTTSLVLPGPHPVGDTWMTLWEYLEPAPFRPLDGDQAVDVVSHLITGMGA